MSKTGVLKTLRSALEHLSSSQKGEQTYYRPMGVDIPDEIEFSYSLSCTIRMADVMTPHSDHLTSFKSGTGEYALFTIMWSGLYFYLVENLVEKNGLSSKDPARKRYRVIPPGFFHSASRYKNEVEAAAARGSGSGSAPTEMNPVASNDSSRQAVIATDHLFNENTQEVMERVEQQPTGVGAGGGTSVPAGGTGSGGTGSSDSPDGYDEYFNLPHNMPTLLFFCEVVPRLRKDEMRVQSDEEIADRTRAYSIADLIRIVAKNESKYDKKVLDHLMGRLESLRYRVPSYSRSRAEFYDGRSAMHNDEYGSMDEESLANDDFFRGEREIDSVTFHLLSNCLFDPGEDLQKLLDKNKADSANNTDRSLGLQLRANIISKAHTEELFDEVNPHFGAGDRPKARKVNLRAGDNRNEEINQVNSFIKGYGNIDMRALCLLFSMYSRNDWAMRQYRLNTLTIQNYQDVTNFLHPLNMFSLVFALTNRGRDVPTKQSLVYYSAHHQDPHAPYSNFMPVRANRAIWRFPIPKLVSSCDSGLVRLVDLMSNPLPFSNIYVQHPLVAKCQGFFSNDDTVMRLKPLFGEQYQERMLMKRLASTDVGVTVPSDDARKLNEYQRRYTSILKAWALRSDVRVNGESIRTQAHTMAQTGTSSRNATDRALYQGPFSREQHMLNEMIGNMSMFESPFDMREMRSLAHLHPALSGEETTGQEDESCIDEFVRNMRDITKSITRLIKSVKGIKRKRALLIIHQMFGVMRYTSQRSPDRLNSMAFKAVMRYIQETNVYSAATRPCLPHARSTLSSCANWIGVMTLYSDTVYQMSEAHLFMLLFIKALSSANLSYNMRGHTLLQGDPGISKSHVVNQVVKTRIDASNLGNSSVARQSRSDESTSAIVTRQSACALQGKSQIMDGRLYVAHEVRKQMFNNKDEDGGADQWWKEILDSCISRVRRAMYDKRTGQLDTVETVTFLRLVFFGCINWSLRDVEEAMRQRYTIIVLKQKLFGEDNIPQKMLASSFMSGDEDLNVTRDNIDRIFREIQAFVTEVEVALASWMRPVNESVAFMIMTYINDYLQSHGMKRFHAREIARFVGTARLLRLIEIYCEFLEEGGRFYGMDFDPKLFLDMDPMFYITPDNLVAALALEVEYSFPQGTEETKRAMQYDRDFRLREWAKVYRNKLYNSDNTDLILQYGKWGYTQNTHPLDMVFVVRESYRQEEEDQRRNVRNFYYPQPQQPPLQLPANQSGSTSTPTPGSTLHIIQQQQQQQQQIQQQQHHNHQQVAINSNFREELARKYDFNYVKFKVPGGTLDGLSTVLYKMMENIPGIRQRPTSDAVYILLRGMKEETIISSPMILNPQRWVPGKTELVVEDTSVLPCAMPVMKDFNGYTIGIHYKALKDTVSGPDMVKRALQEIFNHTNEPPLTYLWRAYNGAYETLNLGYGNPPDVPRRGCISAPHENLRLPNPCKLSEHEHNLINGVSKRARCGNMHGSVEGEMDRGDEMEPVLNSLTQMYKSSADLIEITMPLSQLAEQMRHEQIYFTPEPITLDDLRLAMDSVNEWSRGIYTNSAEEFAWNSVRDALNVRMPPPPIYEPVDVGEGDMDIDENDSSRRVVMDVDDSAESINMRHLEAMEKQIEGPKTIELEPSIDPHLLEAREDMAWGEEFAEQAMNAESEYNENEGYDMEPFTPPSPGYVAAMNEVDLDYPQHNQHQQPQPQPQRRTVPTWRTSVNESIPCIIQTRELTPFGMDAKDDLNDLKRSMRFWLVVPTRELYKDRYEIELEQRNLATARSWNAPTSPPVQSPPTSPGDLSDGGEQQMDARMGMSEWWNQYFQGMKRTHEMLKQANVRAKNSNAALPAGSELNSMISSLQSMLKEYPERSASYDPEMSLADRRNAAQRMRKELIKWQGNFVVTEQDMIPDIDMDWRQFCVPNPFYDEKNTTYTTLFHNQPQVPIWCLLGIRRDHFKSVMDAPLITRLRKCANSTFPDMGFRYPEDIWKMRDKQRSLRESNRTMRLTMSCVSVRALTMPQQLKYNSLQVESVARARKTGRNELLENIPRAVSSGSGSVRPANHPTSSIASKSYSRNGGGGSNKRPLISSEQRVGDNVTPRSKPGTPRAPRNKRSRVMVFQGGNNSS